MTELGLGAIEPYVVAESREVLPIFLAIDRGDDIGQLRRWALPRPVDLRLGYERAIPCFLEAHAVGYLTWSPVDLNTDPATRH